MGNTGLLMCEAKMTLLQPELGETRRQEHRNSPFWHSSLFKSQLVKEGADFLLKKGTLKTLRVWTLSEQARSWFPQQEKRLLQETTLWGAFPHKAVTNRFPQTGGNRTSEAPVVIFRPHNRGRGCGNPSPQ